MPSIADPAAGPCTCCGPSSIEKHCYSREKKKNEALQMHSPPPPTRLRRWPPAGCCRSPPPSAQVSRPLESALSRRRRSLVIIPIPRPREGDVLHGRRLVAAGRRLSRRSRGGASEQAPEKAKGKGGRVSATATTKPAAPYNDGHHTLIRHFPAKKIRALINDDEFNQLGMASYKLVSTEREREIAADEIKRLKIARTMALSMKNNIDWGSTNYSMAQGMSMCEELKKVVHKEFDSVLETVNRAIQHMLPSSSKGQVGNNDSVTAWLRVMALEKLKDCILESQVSDAIKQKNRNNSITDVKAEGGGNVEDKEDHEGDVLHGRRLVAAGRRLSRHSRGGASEQAPEKARGKGGRVSATATTKPAAPYNDGHHTLL